MHYQEIKHYNQINTRLNDSDLGEWLDEHHYHLDKRVPNTLSLWRKNLKYVSCIKSMVSILKNMYMTLYLPKFSKTTLISNILPYSPLEITEYLPSTALFVKLCILVFRLENTVRIGFRFIYHQWALWGFPFKMCLTEPGLKESYKGQRFWSQIAWVLTLLCEPGNQFSPTEA